MPNHTAATIPSQMPAIPPGMRACTPGILALALLSRLLIVWFAVGHFSHNWLYTRGIELGTLAQSLAEGGGLSSPFGGATGPTALLAPGYPALIACLFRIFGCFTLRAAIAIMLMQVVFSVMTVWVIMLIAQRCFNTRAANVAGLFWAVSLPLIWMPTIFWETCLSTLLLVGMVALLLHFEPLASASVSPWMVLGGYCGATGLVNPALLPAMLALFLMWAWPSGRTPWLMPVAGVLTLIAVFAPWPLRNARVLHAFIPLRSTTGFELWVGNRPGASGYLDEDQFPIFNKYELASYVSRGEVLYMRDKWELGKAYIFAHPGRFLSLSLVRMFRFWSGTGSKDGSIIFAAQGVLTSTLGFLGLARLTAEHRYRLLLLFLLPLLLFPLPYYITHAEFRYRLVIDPLLTLLSAYAVTTPGGKGKS